MTDRTAAMKDAKRTINGEKYERVRAVIAQIRDQGRDGELKATIIARRASVHRSFVSSHFAAEIAHAKAEIQSRFIAGLGAQTALSAASLRVEMETAKQQAHEARQEISALKARLARTLGEEIASTRPEHEAASATVKALQAHWPIEASRHRSNEFAVLVGPSSKGRKGSAWDHVEAVLAPTSTRRSSNTASCPGSARARD